LISAGDNHIKKQVKWFNLFQLYYDRKTEEKRSDEKILLSVMMAALLLLYAGAANAGSDVEKS